MKNLLANWDTPEERLPCLLLLHHCCLHTLCLKSASLTQTENWNWEAGCFHANSLQHHNNLFCSPHVLHVCVFLSSSSGHPWVCLPPAPALHLHKSWYPVFSRYVFAWLAHFGGDAFWNPPVPLSSFPLIQPRKSKGFTILSLSTLYLLSVHWEIHTKKRKRKGRKILKNSQCYSLENDVKSTVFFQFQTLEYCFLTSRHLCSKKLI